MPVLSLTSLSKRYGAVGAVSDLSLNVDAGSRTAIVGPSGSGKSTLLRMIAGFEAPDSGTIALNGAVIADQAVMVPPHKRGIGLVTQDGNLFPYLSVAENIGFGLKRHAENRAAHIADLVVMVGLDTAMLKRTPDQLSGGQQQRVALARALALKPSLMLLDEPFSALDTNLRSTTRKAVSDLLTAAGIASILVTHDQAEALSYADQIAVMRNGTILQSGAPRDLYSCPVDAMVAEFLGDAIMVDGRIVGGQAIMPFGRAPVRPGNPDGPVRIMLRPEQVQLALTKAPGAGTVVHVDFAGISSVVQVRLGYNDRLISVRRLGAQFLAVGDCVDIQIEGLAHVLPRPSSGP